jgi:two-component system response regulator HydG
MKDVLVIDDDELSRDLLTTCMASKGLSVESASDGGMALKLLSSERYRLVLAGVTLPGLSGMEILNSVKDRHAETDVIFVTGGGSVESAAECIKQGAFDFLLRPISKARLETLVDRALERQDLILETRTLRRREAAAPLTGGEIVCKSRRMRSMMELVRAAADTDSTVLIRGESGTGKKLIASTIHRFSRRAFGPLVCVRCGALPEELLEAKLFGHESGGFPRAFGRRAGMLELADSGSIVLDDAGELSPALQVKLLRALESRCLRRVGGTRTLDVDVRVISTTGTDLAREERGGTLSEDLHYKLNAVEIRVPPLRDRKEDIPLLASKMLSSIAAASGVRRKWISPAALERMSGYDWPGNATELQNVLQRALVVSKGDLILPEDLPSRVIDGAASPASGESCWKPLDEMEREYVRRVLRACAGNKSKAARLLGIDRGTLARKTRREAASHEREGSRASGGAD